MIDTHAHIHDPKFDEDRTAVVERARTAGLSAIVTVGCDVDRLRFRALECARENRIYSSVGIHPHEAKDAPADIPAIFDSFLRDRAWLRSVRPASTTITIIARATCSVACCANNSTSRARRPSHLSFTSATPSRTSSRSLREQSEPPMRGVVHCFTGDAAQARDLTQEFGLYLGIGGVVTFKTAEPLREAVAGVGLQWLVLETDCPYLAPVPHRGDRNEPAYVALAAQRIAEVLECSFDEVVAATDANARALFPIR